MRRVTIEQSVATAVQPSQRVLQTAAMFGLGVDDQRTINIVPQTEIALPEGGIVFITGPSGGGKSTVLRAIAEQCAAKDIAVIDFEQRDEGADAPLVDAFDLSLEDTTSLLALVGLGDAFVMLRSPGQLSDGQRYRLRLAQAIRSAQQRGGGAVIVADEFGATLDRLTATVIARNLRKWVSKTNHTFVCATTHDDLLEPLEPDVLVYKGLGEEIEVATK